MQKYGIIRKEAENNGINSNHIIALEEFYMRQVKSLKEELYVAQSNLQVAQVKLQNYQSLTKESEWSSKQKGLNSESVVGTSSGQQQAEQERQEKIEKIRQLNRQDQAV